MLAIAIKVIGILAVLLAIQSVLALRDGYRFLALVRRRRQRSPRDYAPEVAVIVPCKGLAGDGEVNLAALLEQDYPAYQLIFVVASVDDGAHARLTELLQRRTAATPPVSLVVAGFAEGRGEKVNNLLRGLAAVHRATQILVFADLDTRPRRDWLRWLVAPLEDPKVTVSTGFRWYLPGARFASRLLAAWDTSIATLLGDHNHNFAWGGSMAIRAANFRRLQVAERYWSNTVSDDYALTRAVREAGGYIHFEPRCLVPSREESTLGGFLQWANRQIIITRVYAPHLWRLGLAAHSLYAVTMLLGLAVLPLPRVDPLARLFVAGLLVSIQLLGMAKGRVRSIVARELFPEENENFAPGGRCYWQLAPLVPWVMLYNFILAGFVRRIEWRGTVYELRSMDEVRVLRRASG